MVESAPAGQPSHRNPGGRALLADLAVLGAIAVVYFYFITAGTWAWQNGPRFYYELLGDALAAGQLSLLVTPSPALLALPDPFDPKARDGIPHLHDASLYQGNYYVYWGPFPGLVHALWKTVTGYSLDQDPVQFVMLGASVVVFWALLRQLRQRHFPTVPRPLVLVLTVLFAVNPTMVYLAGRPIHYHEAIIFGMTMVVLSWPPLLRALSSERHACWYLLLTGVLLGCAAASRMPVLMYAVATGVVLLVRALFYRQRSLKYEALKLLSFGAPLVLTLALLGAYNYARFGSVSEFGLSYLLQGYQEYYDVIVRENRPASSPSSIVPMLSLYLVAVPKLTSHPPYVEQTILVPDSVKAMLDTSAAIGNPLFVDVPVVSVFLIVPIILVALASPLLLLLRWQPSLHPVLTLIATTFIGAMLTLLLLSATPGISVRYTADVVPELTMTASLMVLVLVSRFRDVAAAHRRGLAPATARYLIAFTVLSIVPAVLLGLMFGFVAWTQGIPPLQ